MLTRCWLLSWIRTLAASAGKRTRLVAYGEAGAHTPADGGDRNRFHPARMNAPSVKHHKARQGDRYLRSLFTTGSAWLCRTSRHELCKIADLVERLTPTDVTAEKRSCGISPMFVVANREMCERLLQRFSIRHWASDAFARVEQATN